MQALAAASTARYHAASSAASTLALEKSRPLMATERGRALLSLEFWGHVAFQLDMLHTRCCEELRRRHETARFKEQLERQEGLR